MTIQLLINLQFIEMTEKMQAADFVINSDRMYYVNTSMQYNAIFFMAVKCDIFLMFPHNIDCGYSLELPH